MAKHGGTRSHIVVMIALLILAGGCSDEPASSEATSVSPTKPPDEQLPALAHRGVERPLFESEWVQERVFQLQMEDVSREVCRHIRDGEFERAKVTAVSLADKPGMHETVAIGLRLLAEQVAILAERRKDPQFAADNAAKDELILAVAPQIARFENQAREMDLKFLELKLKSVGTMTDGERHLLALCRELSDLEANETRVIGGLTSGCSLHSIEDVPSAHGFTPGAKAVIRKSQATAIIQFWESEYRYDEARAVSRATTRVEQQQARGDARQRHLTKLIDAIVDGDEPRFAAVLRSQEMARAVLRDEPAFPADRIVTALTRRLRDPSPFVRRNAARELRSYKADALPAVPALVALLNDEDYTIAVAAMTTLSFIGPDAKAAVEPLEKLIDDPALGRAARSTLKKITGKPYRR